ncbi:site-specific integrase [Gracilimonas sp.]|uniref:site-specific integrase n=1 Tax=Gracilimonas sp. TaxID=1974203 RepID=UPI0032EC61BF
MNATINFELRDQKADANGEAPLYLRITYDRKPAWMSLGISLKPKDWNRNKQKVSRSHRRWDVLNEELLRISGQAHDAILELKEQDRLNAKRVIQLLKGQDRKDFYTYADKYIKDLFAMGSVRRAKNAKVILNQIKAFKKDESFPIQEIDHQFIDDFSTYLKTEQSNASNTIRKKFQRLSHMLKRAKRDGILTVNPFDEYKLPAYQKPKKEALSIGQIRKIEKLDLPKGSSIWHTRNYFLFSFYNAGIRFGDLCLLKRKNIVDGRLKYVMSKTTSNAEPKYKNIKLRDDSYEILERYNYGQMEDESYLFPILDTGKNVNDPLIFDREKQSKNAIANKDLKKIAKKAEIDLTLSTHIARHSFANYALKSGMGVYAISKALAHYDLATTESYLKSFDEELLDSEMDALFNE